MNERATPENEPKAKRRLGTAMPLPHYQRKVIRDKDDATTYERHEAWKAWTDKLLRLPPTLTATDKETLPSMAWTQWSSWLADDQQPNQALKESLREGRGLTIVGAPGSGKTRLATLVAAAAATWGIWPKFLSAATLRSAAFSDWPAANKLINDHSKPRLLIIDDLGKAAPSNQGDEIIFQILDNRSMWQKSTIITTQYTPERLATRFVDGETAGGIVRRIGSDFNTPIALQPNQGGTEA
tara:strand:- start:36797 stop:37516 length:720 start_codon:yes stop_codon:yes gene_type:complete